MFQARVVEWIAVSYSRRFSWPRDLARVSCIAGRCFTFWATRESHKVVLEHLENHLMLGHLPENFHPTSFSQCSGSMPQFSSFQSETPIFRLWECSEYPCPCSTCSCLLPFWRPVVVCSISPEHTYIDPLRRRPHPYALWSQQVTSPVHCGPGWALSSHSPILTPQCGGTAEKFRWFGGIKEAFYMPLISTRNSPAILISLTLHRCVTWQR